jgi:hypothetical protein
MLADGESRRLVPRMIRGGGAAGGAGGGREPTGGDADGAPRVVALLRAHGAPAEAARRIARAGETLRQRSVEAGVEIAALLDYATGRPVGPILEGQEDRVILVPQLGLLRPGRRYVQMHTHPGSSSFSDADLRVLLDHPELRTMVVVGHDGGWHLLSRRPGYPTVPSAEGLTRWQLRFLEAALKDNALIAQGILTEAEALAAEAHETMVHLAPEVGLRYDRLETWR